MLIHFRIADTFTDSLVRLSRDEQKAVKTTAFDLQLNHVNPGVSLHKLDRAKDKKFLVSAGKRRSYTSHPIDKPKGRALL